MEALLAFDRPIVAPEPEVVEAAWFKMHRADGDCQRELIFVNEADHSVRPATDAELKAWYTVRPWHIDHGDPLELAVMFEETDGILFGLIAERHRLRATGDEDALRENLDAICRQQPKTDAGAAWMLRLLHDDLIVPSKNMTDEQRRWLCFRGMRWLMQTAHDEQPMQVRTITA